MGTRNENPPWGYLVRIDRSAPILELQERFVPVYFDGKLAFEIDNNESAETTLWVASFPCWVSKTEVKKEMKIRSNSVISVKIERKIEVLFVKNSINEVFLHDANISENYITTDNLLGQGGFGQVFTIYKKSSGQRQALKVQLRSTRNALFLNREAEILVQLEHPCVIQTHDIKFSKTRMYIIMEYMNGGDLSRFVNFQGRHLSEQETKLIFYQIVKAVYYLHSKGICHRDLKPANILLCHPQPITLIKVSDLGLAKSEVIHSTMYSWCGTEAFMAPEVLEFGRQYDKKVDVWSMGVILYLSWSGTLPMFSGDTLQFTGDKSLWTNTPVMNLLQGMLCKQPLKRLDICMVTRHHWLQDKTTRKKVTHLINNNAKTGKPNKQKPKMKQRSLSNVKPVPAKPVIADANTVPEFKTVVNKPQSQQVPEGNGKSATNKTIVNKDKNIIQSSPLKKKKKVQKKKNKKVVDPETVKYDQNVDSISTYESMSQSNIKNNKTTNTGIPLKPIVPTGPYMEKKPEVNYKYKTNNDNNLSHCEENIHLIDHLKYNELDHYERATANKESLDSRYKRNIPKTTSKAGIFKPTYTSYAPIVQYEESNPDDLFYDNIVSNNTYYENYRIKNSDSFYYTYDNYNTVGNAYNIYNNQNHTKKTGKGFLSSVFYFSRVLGYCCVVGIVTVRVFSYFTKK